MIEGELEKWTEELWDQFQRSCDKHKDRIIGFLEQGSSRTIVGVKPYGILFSLLLYRYLGQIGKSNNLALTTAEEDGSGLDGGQIRGREVIIVDGDIANETTYLKVTRAVRSFKPTSVLYLTWRDNLGLADIALKDSGGRAYVNAQVAGQKLGIHPDTFSRLCRENKVKGAQRQGKSWIIKKEDLDEFIREYNPGHGGRPKKESLSS